MIDEKITIIIPVYNTESYLTRCINSILTQTYRNLQVILIDDGSTDASGDICDSFTQKDPRVQVIHKSNEGPTLARKAGLVRAEGEYVAFVDSDDYIEASMYEKLLGYLHDTGADFVHSGHVTELKNGSMMECFPEKEASFNRCEGRDIILKDLFGKQEEIVSTLWGKLFKRNLIQECHAELSDRLFFGEDFICIFLCMLRCNKFAVKKSVYYHYRVRDGSLSGWDGDMFVFARLGEFYRAMLDTIERHNCLDDFKESLNAFLVRNILKSVRRLENKEIYVPLYQYKNVNEVLEKRVVIYGAGYVGQDYYAQLCKYSSCEIVALADTYPEKSLLEYTNILGLRDITVLEFDMVIIAVLDESVMTEIKYNLLAAGIPEEKIVWKKPELVI